MIYHSLARVERLRAVRVGALRGRALAVWWGTGALAQVRTDTAAGRSNSCLASRSRHQAAQERLRLGCGGQDYGDEDAEGDDARDACPDGNQSAGGVIRPVVALFGRIIVSARRRIGRSRMRQWAFPGQGGCPFAGPCWGG